jgi:GT2 family glycosyltransferase
MKILIAVPTGREIEVQTAATLIGMHRIGEIGVFMPTGYSVDVSRNLIVEHAIEYGYDYILWVDSDMILPKNALVKLWAHDKDIVSGVYAYKILNGENAVVKRFKDKEADIYEDIPLKEIREREDLFEVDGIGFGCVLTKVDMFRNIGKPWFVYSPDMGEDIYFCRKAQATRYKVWLDPTIRCGHCGKVDFNI